MRRKRSKFVRYLVFSICLYASLYFHVLQGPHELTILTNIFSVRHYDS